MTVYYITIAFTFVFAYLASLKKNKLQMELDVSDKQLLYTRVFLYLISFVLILVAGLRYFVGTDYGAYYRALQNYAPRMWESIKELDEPGFPILATIIKCFTSDGAVFIFVTAAFTVGSILYITYKYVDTYLFSSLLFIFSGVWHGSFNGVRQFFAAAIICLAHRFILEKKAIKYFLCVFIAYLFHGSAIIMVIPYFILRNKVSFRNVLLLAIGSVVLLYNYEFIFSFVSNVKNEMVTMEADTYMLKQVNIFRVLVCVAPAIFGLFLYSRLERNNEQTFYLNIMLLYALLSIIGMNSPYLSRVNIYLLVLLPLSMGKIVVFHDKKTEFMIKWIIVALYFLFWYYEVSNSGSLCYFRWIWER